MNFSAYIHPRLKYRATDPARVSCKWAPVGSYAIQPSFDDGHDTGIYSWETLYDLGKNKHKYWQEYLQKLAAAGHKHKENS